MGEEREATSSAGIDWPQVRDMFAEREAAKELAEKERRKALDLQRESDNQRLQDLEKFFIGKVESADKTLGERVRALKELVAQYQKLRRDQDIAAEQEREKAAAALRDSLQNAIDSRYETLKQHVQHNREQLESSISAAKEAIDKAEAATDKRFDTIQKNLDGMQNANEQKLPREIFETTAIELRERADTNLKLIQALTLRMTEMEARGGGEKDHAAELKATLAIGVAVVSVIASIAINLIALFGS